MRQLPDAPVFTRAQARSLGWTDSALSRAMGSGRLVVVRRGYLARVGTPNERTVAAAAVHDIAGSVLSHRSALLMHDLPIVGARPTVPEITVQPNGRGSAHAALLHRATMLPDEIVVVDDVPITSVARTVIDVARSRPTTVAVAAIDAALHRDLVTLDDLDEICLRCWNWPGIGRALRAVRRADGRAESPLESVSRLVLGWLRLPAADLQPLALDRHGYPAGRLDFYWDEYGVAGEADGRSKYDGRDVLTKEKNRQELLENHHLVFARWGWTDVVRQPHLLRSRVESAFERGRARDRSGLPRAWSISRAKPGTREEKLIVRR